MTEDVTNELLYEILKQIRDNVTHIKRRVDDHDEHLKGIRHMLVAMQSDDLRHEATISGLRADVDRIKNRLELTDA
jgi:uncharacterized protein YukE